ncbi:MAG TPA: response regulator [Bdellovibrionota bacterium]|nr:response regulator [Bdellovibrionota bacterium]
MSANQVEVKLRGAKSLKGLRVLVVDDEEDGRVALAECLKTYGIEVITAASAREALQSLSRYRPDVLVSDIGMPGEDGCSLMRDVRSLPKDRGGDTPSLALTAYAAETDVQLALSEGYQAHVPKPVDVTKLTEAISDLLSDYSRDARRNNTESNSSNPPMPRR